MRILITLLLTFGLAACSIKPANRNSAKGPAPVANTPPEDDKNVVEQNIDKKTEGSSMQMLATKETTAMKTPPRVPAKPWAKTATAIAEATPTPTPPPKRGPIPADKSLSWLKNGNTRFVKHFLRNDGDLAKDRNRLVPGQKPHAIVISCSDSRVPPEVVFDQKLGEIFVIRTVGESLDASAIGSIEYALNHLGSNLIVVMGHDSCGAVREALATLDGSDAGSPWLNKLVQDLHPHLKSFKGKPASADLAVEGWANVSGVAKDLVDRSQIVRDAVNSGEVKIQTALYRLGTGVVEFK